MKIARRLIAALWLGSGAFLIAVAAPAAFKAAPNALTAANVVGAMLTRWHYLALAAPLLLLAIEWRHARARVMTILAIAIVLASLQAFADLRIRAIRFASLTPIGDLPREHPTRRRFGMLHAASSLLLLGQVVAAAAVTAAED